MMSVSNTFKVPPILKPVAQMRLFRIVCGSQRKLERVQIPSAPKLKCGDVGFSAAFCELSQEPDGCGTSFRVGFTGIYCRVWADLLYPDVAIVKLAEVGLHLLHKVGEVFQLIAELWCVQLDSVAQAFAGDP